MLQSLRNNISILIHAHRQIRLSSLAWMIPCRPCTGTSGYDKSSAGTKPSCLTPQAIQVQKLVCTEGRGGQVKQTPPPPHPAGPLASAQRGSGQTPGCQLEGCMTEARSC